MCQQRAEYVVPCSTQSQCPDLWSAPVRCAHWMPILGDPGAHEMGVPSRNGDPESTSGKPSPTPRQEPTPAATGPHPSPRAARVLPAPAALPAGSQQQWPPPGAQLGPIPHPQPSESRPAQPGFTPPRARSRHVSSRRGHLRERNWEGLPHPRQEPTPAPRSRCFPSRSGDPREHNWDRPPPPPRPDSQPAPPGFAPPLALCPTSPGAPGEPRPHAPTPGSSRGSRTSLLPPGQTRGQYIHHTETIQAVYDLGIERGLQKGKMA